MSVRTIPLNLSFEEECDLVSLAKENDSAAIDKLYQSCYGLLRKESLKFSNYLGGLDVAMSHAVCGFYASIRKFDKRKGCRFNTLIPINAFDHLNREVKNRKRTVNRERGGELDLRTDKEIMQDLGSVYQDSITNSNDVARLSEFKKESLCKSEIKLLEEFEKFNFNVRTFSCEKKVSTEEMLRVLKAIASKMGLAFPKCGEDYFQASEEDQTSLL
jgi:DNA-directed RNA polymerase specialized sigma subunit